MALTPANKQSVIDLIGKECIEAETTAKNLYYAPEACSVVQALAILACCTKDPSLRSGARDETFKYLSRPDSFKASLYQVINAMCDAFRTAHNSMDKIQLSLNSMPDLMMDTVDAMNHIEEVEAQDIANYALDIINTSAKRCVKAANEADEEFEQALKIITELSVAAIATQGKNEKRAEEAELELKEHEALQYQKNAFLKDLENQIQEQKKVVEEATNDYKVRMSQSSDLSGVVGVMFVDNFTTLIQALGDSAVNVTGLISNLPVATGVAVAAALKKKLTESEKSLTKQELLGIAMESVLLELMEDVVSENNETLKLQADVHINNLRSANSYKTGTEIGKMLRASSKAIIEGLQNIKTENPGSCEKFDAIKTDARLKLKAFAKTTNEFALDGDDDQGNGNHGSRDKIFESAALKAKRCEERQTLMKARLENFKLAKETMSAEKELQEKLRLQKKEADEELHKIMINLERLKIEEVDLKEVIIYLQQGIQQLGKVQIAWRNVAQFFSKIKNTVEGPLIDHIKGMKNNADNIIKSGNPANNYQRQLLHREITKACVVANVLMQSAELYKTISTKHVMPIIDQSILNIGLTKDEARSKQYAITENFKKIQTAVTDTIEQHGEHLSTKVYAKMRLQGFDVGRAIENRRRLDAIN